MALRLQLLTTPEQCHRGKEQCTNWQRALGVSSGESSCSTTICTGLSLQTVPPKRLPGDLFLMMSHPPPCAGDWHSVLRTKNLVFTECRCAELNHAPNHLSARCSPGRVITQIHSFAQCIFECLALGRQQRKALGGLHFSRVTQMINEWINMSCSNKCKGRKQESWIRGWRMMASGFYLSQRARKSLFW